MSAPRTDTTPPDSTWTVTDLRPIGSTSWQVLLLDPEGKRHALILSDGQVTMRSIRLAAQAVRVLWCSKRGATPRAVG